MTPTKEQMKRVVKPMVEREEDWQNTLEAVKDAFDMEASDENRSLIMDVISECEEENGETYDQRRRREAGY
jgi:hypothetical protein